MASEAQERARFSPRNPPQPMQLLLLLPPRDDLPEMPTRDVPVHRVVHNNRPSARQRGRGAAPMNDFTGILYLLLKVTSSESSWLRSKKKFVLCYSSILVEVRPRKQPLTR